MRKERVRYDMRTANTLSHAAMSVRHARKKWKENVRATRSVVYTPGRTHFAAACVRNPEKKKLLGLRHSMSNLTSPTRTCSTFLLSTNCQMYEFMLLGFPRHALLVILDDVLAVIISSH